MVRGATVTPVRLYGWQPYPCGRSRPGRQERTGGITMTLIVLGVVLPWLAIGLGGWFGFQLLRQNGRLLFRLQALEQRLAQLPTAPGPSLQPAPSGPHGLSVGSVAPAFELPDLNGGRGSLEQFR